MKVSIKYDDLFELEKIIRQKGDWSFNFYVSDAEMDDILHDIRKIFHNNDKLDATIDIRIPLGDEFFKKSRYSEFRDTTLYVGIGHLIDLTGFEKLEFFEYYDDEEIIANWKTDAFKISYKNHYIKYLVQ